jgi:hypothetical protein
VPRSLLVLLGLAALAIVAVLFTLLDARGFGVLATTPAPPRPPGAPASVPVAGVRASSSLPASGVASYGPSNIVDENPETAWNEAASGPGPGEWIELRLAEPATVTRLLVWNGYQKGAQFVENSRLRTVSLAVGPRTFTVDLLDVEGPQAVDLPEPVRAERVRLTVERVYPGSRYPDAAVSEVEVIGVVARRASEPPRR